MPIKQIEFSTMLDIMPVDIRLEVIKQGPLSDYWHTTLCSFTQNEQGHIGIQFHGIGQEVTLNYVLDNLPDGEIPLVYALVNDGTWTEWSLHEDWEFDNDHELIIQLVEERLDAIYELLSTIFPNQSFGNLN